MQKPYFWPRLRADSRPPQNRQVQIVPLIAIGPEARKMIGGVGFPENEED